LNKLQRALFVRSHEAHERPVTVDLARLPSDPHHTRPLITPLITQKDHTPCVT